MNYLFIPLMALALFAGTPAIEAKCQQPDPGPTGPLTTDFISAASNGTIQVIESPNPAVELIEYPFITAQNNILHPNSTDFVIENDGVYLITWASTGTTNYNMGAVAPRLFTRLLLNGSNFAPEIQAIQDLIPIDTSQTPDAFSAASLSGQTILQLNTGDVLQMSTMAIFHLTEGAFFEITDNLLTITRIAEPQSVR